METAENEDTALRVNYAHALLKKKVPSIEIAERLSRKFSTSKVKAYAYLQQARKIKDSLPTLQKSVNFTVKLNPDLAGFFINTRCTKASPSMRQP